jgi:hypothetical protein
MDVGQDADLKHPTFLRQIVSHDCDEVIRLSKH